MDITNISIRKLNEGRLKASVTITLDNQLAIHNIKLIEGADKRFLAMPSKRLRDGSFLDIVHPISPEFRNKLETAVFEMYEKTDDEAVPEMQDDN